MLAITAARALVALTLLCAILIMLGVLR